MLGSENVRGTRYGYGGYLPPSPCFFLTEILSGVEDGMDRMGWRKSGVSDTTSVGPGRAGLIFQVGLGGLAGSVSVLWRLVDPDTSFGTVIVVPRV